MTTPIRNFAWFVTKSGPPNEAWQFLNSLQGLRDAMDYPAREGNRVYLEFGPVQSPGHDIVPSLSLPLGPDSRNMPSVYRILDIWKSRMYGGPLFVFGKRNLFEPLLHHYSRSRGDAAVPALPAYDILEELVQPGSIPTLEDRVTCNRQVAAWMTGKPMLQPLDFWKHLTSQ